MKTGIELIANERQRQIAEEGFNSNHDSVHQNDELPVAAACYAVNKITPPVDVLDRNDGLDAWPWGGKWDKRKKHNRMRSLIIAGALIAAEIDRIQRQ